MIMSLNAVKLPRAVYTLFDPATQTYLYEVAESEPVVTES